MDAQPLAAETPGRDSPDVESVGADEGGTIETRCETFDTILVRAAQDLS